MGACKACNLYQQIKKEWQCVAGRLPSIAYRDTKQGNCALTNEEIKEKLKWLVSTKYK